MNIYYDIRLSIYDINAEILYSRVGRCLTLGRQRAFLNQCASVIQSLIEFSWGVMLSHSMRKI